MDSTYLNDIKKAAAHRLLNRFINIGDKGGCNRHVVFTKTILEAKNLTVDTLPISTPEFKHLYIYEQKTLVGSLIVSRSKFSRCKPNAITYVPDITDEHDYVCPAESESSGIYLLTNGNGGYAAIISNLPLNDLVVQDREL